MKLASSVKVVMNLRKSMYVKNTTYRWGKKKHKTPNKTTKTTATIYLAVFRQIDGFITSYEIKISSFIKSYKKKE